VQRKPGTARGSPRRSRTAKALRISRYAVKSRCACERGGWGLSALVFCATRPKAPPRADLTLPLECPRQRKRGGLEKRT
jgi:hypothetical protein